MLSDSPIIHHELIAPAPGPKVQHQHMLTETESSLHLAPAPEAQQHQQAPEGFMDIWADNEASGYQCLKKLLGDANYKWYVTVDAEFFMKEICGERHSLLMVTMSRPEGSSTRATWFKWDLRSPTPSTGLIHTLSRYFSNILFDYTARSSTSKNIRFLRDQEKLNLDDHASKSIGVRNFINGINNTLCILGNRNITWITFQGYLDFGYIIRAVKDTSVLIASRT